jgi:NADPH-dependent 2,4-dienoyl-CoA reductase/sulfur reductase-like enzyme
VPDRLLPVAPRAIERLPEPVGPPAHPVRSVVVVGAGLAGAQSVAALRAQGFDGRVTLLGAEGRAPYDRPPLSKHLLDRRDPAWLTDELGVDVAALADDVRLATPATGLVVRPTGVRVATAQGEVLADAVVLASGSHSVRPPHWSGALTLHTADDAAILRDLLHPGSRLVIVGAGWIGAEVAGVAAAAGVEVTVVEAATTPLAVALGGFVGGLVAPWYAAAGVPLLAGVPADDVRADGVRLADGRELPADVVLVAVGARPATAWLRTSLPRDPDGSLRVDEGYGVLGVPGHVRAVGDIARRWSARHGWVAGGHWDGALRGPATAVRALLGARDAPAPGTAVGSADDPAPYVFSTQLGHDLVLNGQHRPGDEVVLRGDPTGTGGWTALWFTPELSAPTRTLARAGSDKSVGRELTAALAVDRPRDVAAARRLFTAAALPVLDPTVAGDPTRPLRDAAV